MDRRGWGITFFRPKHLSHSTEKFPRGTLVIQKCSGVEFFLDNRSITSLSFFLSHTAKKFLEQPFCVSECFGYRNTSCLGREYHDFVSKNCCPTVPKKFVGDSFCLSQSCIQKFYGKEGGGSITFFCQKFLV